jgi:hypothetical protein
VGCALAGQALQHPGAGAGARREARGAGRGNRNLSTSDQYTRSSELYRVRVPRRKEGVQFNFQNFDITLTHTATIKFDPYQINPICHN